MSLSTLLFVSHTNRKHDFETNFYCRHHMGVGAAVHVSSVMDPVDLWMKRCGVIEQSCSGLFSSDFVTAARNGRVTPDMIFKNSFQPLCYALNKGNLLSVLSLPYPHRAVFENAVPWVVRGNPDVFPFMLPANVSSGNVHTENSAVRFGLMDWNKLC